MGVFKIEIDDIDFSEGADETDQLSDVDAIYVLKEVEWLTFQLVINGSSYERKVSKERSWSSHIFN